MRASDLACDGSVATRSGEWAGIRSWLGFGARVDDLNHELLAGEQVVGHELAGAEGSGSGSSAEVSGSGGGDGEK